MIFDVVISTCASFVLKIKELFIKIGSSICETCDGQDINLRLFIQYFVH